MDDLLKRLQTALGQTYRIDQELGGGGMSRVFLAEEVRLGRQVVIKVLPPEMAAGVSVERFEREIQLAASLQHPHIVPLLTAGSAESDLLYYVMPFIDGESLRAKLAREGELPIGETVQILREVTDALAHAHRHGVVHRDIKPDNVLLSGNHALVADFGVAKAVNESSGGQSLTSLGVALGTPAYMAPEQAAASPHIDHRADIYAVGALAYEMLTGRPPFTGANPQQVLSAHVTQAPDPVTMHRDTVPPALSELVMRCLAKKAADRWQKSDDLLAPLAAMATPSGGMTPTGSQPIASGVYRAVAQNHPVRVAALFGGAAVLALVIVYTLMMVLGLPNWVFVGAVTLLVIGVPIIAVTGMHERDRALAATTGLYVDTPSGLQRHFTWKTAIRGGGVAFAGLAVVAGGYAVTRDLGIGPAATLMTAGVLDEQERVILADFENRTADSTLGETVTELFRIDLAQSPSLIVLEPTQVNQILRRMEQESGTRLTAQLAQDAAEREGITAYVTGDVVSVGTGFVVTGRVIATATGESLVSHREQAASADDIVGAVDRLSAKLRERIGEPLRTVRKDPPLDRVTTSSMEALRLYAQAALVGSATAEYDRAIQLLEQAVALDSTFAMAHRKLAVWNINASRMERAESAATRAYDLRSRVGERERWLIEGTYHGYVTEDEAAEENAYLSLLDKYPNDRTALNNQAINYRGQGRHSDAADLLLRSVRNGGAPGSTYTGLLGDLGNLGRLDEAAEVLEKFKTDFPNHPSLGGHEVRYAYNRGDVQEAEQRARQWREEAATNPQFADDPIFMLTSLAQLHGRVAESLRLQRDAMMVQIEWAGDRIPEEIRANLEANIAASMRGEAIDARLWYGLDPPVTTEEVESELRYIRDQLPDSMFYPYDFISVFAQLGEVDRAQDMYDEIRRKDAASESPVEDAWRWHVQEARLALARGDAAEAARLYRAYRDASPTCNFPGCVLFEIGMAYDSAGMTDSARVYFERYLTDPAWSRVYTDAREKPVILRRLGELYEERDASKAVGYYNEFVELWANADPELLPIVEGVRATIARLTAETR